MQPSHQGKKALGTASREGGSAPPPSGGRDPGGDPKADKSRDPGSPPPPSGGRDPGGRPKADRGRGSPPDPGGPPPSDKGRGR